MSTTTTLLVDGMTCDHCVASIRKAVGGVAGVTDVAVDLPSGQVTVTADSAPDQEALRAAVEDAGYDLRS
jgi:copper ion binding protein